MPPQLHLSSCTRLGQGRRPLRPSFGAERAAHGDVRDFLHQEVAHLDIRDKVDLRLDVIAGLAVLQRAGIVHGDIKADNALIFDSPLPVGR
jgi:hypothetical protein